ncbi:MAG: TraM recognition domain-containing protein [Alphaproteobacteria bacterium]
MRRTLYLGMSDGPRGPEPFGIPGQDRFRHLYVIGASGTGKSTLLHNVLAQEMRSGEGCGLIDPHGDLAGAALSLVPRHRTEDVALIELADREHPPALNPLYHVPADSRALVAANLVAGFKHIWRESWGPRLEYILLNALLTLLDAPDRARPTLLAVPRLLTDANYRAWILSHTRDPRVRAFWREEFASYTERFANEALAPIQNKIGALLASPAVRNVIGQWGSRIDIDAVVNGRGILIVNLAKGAIGAEPANLMGALIVAMVQSAAMARSATPEAERAPFHLLVDEFAYVVTGAFVDILSEARKYRLAITLAHQHLSQIDERVRAAVTANVATLVAFRVGAEDAAQMAVALGDIAAPALGNLGRGEAWVRVSPEHTLPTCYMIKTFRGLDGVAGRRERVLRSARDRSTRPRSQVEHNLSTWLAR